MTKIKSNGMTYDSKLDALKGLYQRYSSDQLCMILQTSPAALQNMAHQLNITLDSWLVQAAREELALKNFDPFEVPEDEVPVERAPAKPIVSMPDFFDNITKSDLYQLLNFKIPITNITYRTNRHRYLVNVSTNDGPKFVTETNDPIEALNALIGAESRYKLKRRDHTHDWQLAEVLPIGDEFDEFVARLTAYESKDTQPVSSSTKTSLKSDHLYELKNFVRKPQAIVTNTVNWDETIKIVLPANKHFAENTKSQRYAVLLSDREYQRLLNK